MSAILAPSSLKSKLVRPGNPGWHRVTPFGYLAMALIAFVSVFPFYWMFVVASSTSDAISQMPPSMVPGPRFFEVIKHVYEIVPFNRALLNTAFVGTVVAISQVMFSALAGFAFAKLRFRGRKFMILFVVGTMMLPSQLGIIPMFMLIARLGWIDSLLSLIHI